MLYEVAAITKPTTTELEGGAMPRIVLEPMTIIAVDETSAVLKVVQEKLVGKDLNRIEVLVRPF